MRVLIAEDDPVSRRLLEVTLAKWGYQPIVTTDGEEAFRHLSADDAPHLAILDVMMPKMDGLEVCRRVRALPGGRQTYIILLTAKSAKDDVVEGLDAGADDYLSKPFDRAELRSRMGVGVRVVELQQSLAERVRELEEALGRVNQLQELLPMCSYCKMVRDDSNYWQQVDSYISAHSATRFSHGICPDCAKSVLEPQMLRMRAQRAGELPGEA